MKWKRFFSENVLHLGPNKAGCQFKSAKECVRIKKMLKQKFEHFILRDHI